jgi:protein tyrosine phosphatase
LAFAFGWRNNIDRIISGPRAKSLTDFWRMIWEQKVERIAMLTNLVEIGNVID